MTKISKELKARVLFGTKFKTLLVQVITIAAKYKARAVLNNTIGNKKYVLSP
jgi:hypothetical protein